MSKTFQPPHTTLYLSGSSYKGEIYVKKHRKRLVHVGVLLSFYDLQRRGVTWRRLVGLKEHEPACVACSGSGESTIGRPCVPCRGTGRVQQK